jgi:hypothetical protein
MENTMPSDSTPTVQAASACGLAIKPTLSAAWPALLLASVILLPWLGKAHTIDDTTFLLQAAHVLKDPLHPTAFEVVADGNRIRLSSKLVSGPLMAYLLVPSVLLGGAEWAAHLVQYLLMLVAILATVSLAFRLGVDGCGARFAGLLLASTPAVMVMATTSMADVPAMAFAVLGMERFVAWRHEFRWHQCLATVICFSFAALARPHLILILPVAFALECGSILPLLRKPSPSSEHPRNAPHAEPVLQGRSRAERTLLLLCPLFLAAILTVFVAAVTADPLRPGSDFMRVAFSRIHAGNIASNLAAFFLHWIFVFPLVLLWLCLGVGWKRLPYNPALWLATAIAIMLWILDRSTLRVGLRSLALACVGAFVLLDILFDAWRHRDGVHLFLVTWLLISLPAIAYVQLPSKYLAPSAPAAAILLSLLVKQRRPGLRFMHRIAVSAGVCLSLLITAADAEFAAVGRRVAADQIAPRVAEGIRVWINSEWGFQWYALKAGAIPVSNQPPYPSPGDVLVSSSAAPHLPLDLYPNRHQIASFTENSRFGRIMTRPAGFYSNGYGYLPWYCRNGEIEKVTIWYIH